MHKISFALVLVLLASLGAQQPPATAPAAQGQSGGVTFSSTTQLVVETVVVKDKNGKALEGLTAKDFLVTEDGKPQNVAFCEFQKIEETPAGAAPAPPTVPTVKVDPVTRTQIAAEKPGDIRYRDRRLMAIYFDMTAMPVPDQVRALEAAQKFIKSQMGKQDLMALMTYSGGGVQVLQDFTDDRDDLLARIDKLIVVEGQGFDPDAGYDSDADTGAAFGQDNGEFVIFTTDRQLAALQTAVKMLGNLQEKKSLVYFASGLRLNGVNNRAQLQATINSAIRSNVSLYPIDARGLMAQAPLGDATKGSPGGLGMYSGSSAMANLTGFQRSQDTLYT